MLRHRCDVQVLDGIWGEWSEYSACSSTCDYGLQTRSRDCLVEDTCDDDESMESILCLIANCPGERQCLCDFYFCLRCTIIIIVVVAICIVLVNNISCAHRHPSLFVAEETIDEDNSVEVELGGWSLQEVRAS